MLVDMYARATFEYDTHIDGIDAVCKHHDCQYAGTSKAGLRCLIYKAVSYVRRNMIFRHPKPVMIDLIGISMF